MKVLYVGGTGEISQACVDQSLKLGHQVTLFNRGTHAVDSKVDVVVGDFGKHRPYHALRGRTFDVVCQFLAYDEKAVARDIEQFSGSCEQYIFISTASAYQKPSPHYVITEQVPLDNPFWAYSRAKAYCEKLLQSQDKLNATIVRPSHTYRTRLPGAIIDGNHQTWRLLNNKPIVIHGDGQSLWTLTYASDFARAFTQLFLAPEAMGSDFHITKSHAHTWDKIIQETGKVLNVEPDIVHVASDTLIQYESEWKGPLLGDKSNSVVFDNQKIKAIAPDWQCEVSLTDGLTMASKFVLERLKAGYEPDAKADALIDQIIADHNAK